VRAKWFYGLVVFAVICAVHVPTARGQAGSSAATQTPSAASFASPADSVAATSDDSAVATATPDATSALTTQTSSSTASSSDGFWDKWFARVDKTQGEQPRWITPLATTTPRLEEEFRYDIAFQHPHAGADTNSYGFSKGLELIPAERVEIIISPPPYVARSGSDERDGFGDMSFLMKYRLLAGNAEHGNYILTVFLGATVPTGDHHNGLPDATVTPTIAGGKGFGNFDVQSTLGITLPTGDTDLIGRTIAWNTAFQYRIHRIFWPEVEVNSSFFNDGPHDGDKQTFITPGLVLGRLHLWRRLGLTVGGGIQIATTQFHLNNHNAILSVRFPF
jgi:hypothetical protein